MSTHGHRNFSEAVNSLRYDGATGTSHAGQNGSQFQCSPLVTFSATALQENTVALQKLETQKQDVLDRIRILGIREAEETSTYEHRITHLTAEERRQKELLDAVVHSIARFQVDLSTMDSDGVKAKFAYEDDVKALEEELASMAELEVELKLMQQHMADRYSRVQEKKRESARMMESGLSQLTRINEQALQIARAAPLIPRSPISLTSSYGVSSSSGLVGGGGALGAASMGSPLRYESRAISPSKTRVGLSPPKRVPRYAPEFPVPAESTSTTLRRSSIEDIAAKYQSRTSLGGASPSTAAVRNGDGGGANRVASPRDNSNVSPPKRSTTPPPDRGGNGGATSAAFVPRISGLAHASAISPPPSNTPRGVTTSARSNPTTGSSSTIATSGPLSLHDLCRDGHDQAARAMIKANPAAVNTLDDKDNTPLHAACASQRISIPLVRDMLLAGASTSVLNRDGFAPFHLASLNLADTDHALKKFLIFKAAVNPNQRTARGLTVAHLCAGNDRYHDNLKFFETVGVDFDVAALLSDAGQGQGAGSVLNTSTSAAAAASGNPQSPQKAKPVDRSRAAGAAAARNLKFLESVAKKPGS